MFQTSNTSLSLYFFCNSRTHVITLYSGHVCDVLCVNALVLTTHMILVRTNHPCLRVGRHNMDGGEARTTTSLEVEAATKRSNCNKMKGIEKVGQN
jgi:hypothetical protein